ncbi:histone deacetylase 8 [Schizopora paradoxa]|uniref:histone deacetylase n=1 Tax=Schizopora paradoxa TaxID=27342 RepID=A0A0H2RY22_9AGAM|nr:histone deacetylase 8 [Schizopora paradoxa]
MSETATSSEPRIAYVVSQELVKISSLLPSNKNRSFLVHSLINKLNLLSNSTSPQELHKINIISPRRATKDELCLYHDEEYLDFVLDESHCQSATSDFGIEDDCPPFSGLHNYIPLVAGATIAAVDQLVKNLANVAICWDGGRHHAQKTHASGFCYVADCILAILAFKKAPIPAPMGAQRKSRIMYLDLDLHFSDAVTQCFYNASQSRSMPQVLTLSVHYDSPGFFPPSLYSGFPDPKSENFDPLSLSLPLQRGASASTYTRIWHIIEDVQGAFDPDFVIVQCGVDGLAGDPCGMFNWSIDNREGDMAWCIDQVVNKWNRRTLLLGGGGYNSPNAARAWAHLTSVTRGRRIPEDTPVPDHSAFPLYSPSFTLDIPKGNMIDENTNDYLKTLTDTYSGIVKQIQEIMSA